jgi:hypothetical protein
MDEDGQDFAWIAINFNLFLPDSSIATTINSATDIGVIAYNLLTAGQLIYSLFPAISLY